MRRKDFNDFNMAIIDIHSHRCPPYPEGIISCEPTKIPPPGRFPEQKYSVGIHPRSLSGLGITDEDEDLLSAAATREDVVMIGESGIDLAYTESAPLAAQMLAFRRHIILSEEVGKPLIIHCVKGWDSVIALRKEFKPRQPWIIHGFRGKPSILMMLLRAGICVSYGEKFNPESVSLTPPGFLFAETDESPLPITDIIATLSKINPAITEEALRDNISSLEGAP